MSEPEKWAAIPGWEDRYQVSDQGRVRSLDMQTPAGLRKGRILKSWITIHGYEQVQLSRAGKRKGRPVHQLVLEAFIGERPEGYEACHGDANKLNNRVGNLRWDTVSENRLDIVRAGNNKQANKTVCSRGHELSGANLRVDSRGWRRCLACARASSYARNVLNKPVTIELADKYYKELTEA